MSIHDPIRRSGDSGADEIERILRELRDPNGPEVILIGRIPREALGRWPDRATDNVVITRERRNHYLERHPDMIEFEARIVGMLLDPAEVHVNRKDRQMAIFYAPLNDRLLIRVPVLISTRPDLRNSVMSARRSDIDQLEAGRQGGRLIWRKK